MKKYIGILLLAIFLPAVFTFSACKSQDNSADRTSVRICFMNGVQPQSQILKVSEKLSIENPQSIYYNFVGWYTDKNYENVFNINDPVGYITEMYAKWQRKENFSGNEKIAADIQQLIIIAETLNYNGQRAQKTVCQYIRSSRYNSNQWNFLCGTVPRSYENKISSEYSDYAYLKTLNSINFGITEIDFVHFIATLNAVLGSGENSSVANLCGYLGDLAQVAVLMTGSNPDEIYASAKDMIGADSGVFPASDFWADAFAIVLGHNAKEKDISFAEILCEYLNKSEQEIVSEFISICFVNTTRQGLINTLSVSFDDILISKWITDNGGASEIQKQKTVEAFADYLLEFVA